MSKRGGSSKVIDDRFQVFKTNFEDVSVLTEEYIEHRPLSNVKRGQRIDIMVPRSNGYYYDLSRSYLRITVKITKAGETALVPSNENPDLIDYCAFVNHAPLFQSMSFFVENVDFARDCNCLLGYKQNIDYLLYKNKEYLESTAAAAHFFYDTASAMNSSKPSSAKGSNAGLLARYELTKNGNYITLEIPLPVDLAQSCSSYLPNKVELRLSLYPSLEKMHLICESETELYESHVDNVVFCLMAVTPRPELLALHNKRFLKENALFTYEKSVLKSYTISKGDSVWDMDSLYGDRIPRALHVAFVKTGAYIGSYDTNPFAYENLGINRIIFYAEGIPDKVLTPDFSTQGNCSTEYMNLYRSPAGAARSGIITMADFKAGYAIFKIDIVESMFQTRKGVNRLSVRFASPLEHNVTAIVYGVFSDSFQMDSARHIV